MNKQSGVIAQVYLFGAVAIAAFAAGGTAAWTFQGMRLDTCKAAAETFRIKVEAAGEVAKAKAEAQAVADKQRKEASDEENRKARAADRATIKRLRDARASTSGSIVPSAPTDSSRPGSACFDRALLSRAIRDLDQGVQGLVDEGTAATIDLNSAKKWAQGLTLKMSTKIVVK